MCKLLIGIKTSNEQQQKFHDIISAQIPELESMNDGIGAITADNKNKVEVFRSLSDYDTIFNKTLSSIANKKFVGIHARKSTSGLVNENNVHFFGDKNYLMAHNGVVSDFLGSTYFNQYGGYGGQNKELGFMPTKSNTAHINGTKSIQIGTNDIEEMTDKIKRGCSTCRAYQDKDELCLMHDEKLVNALLEREANEEDNIINPSVNSKKEKRKNKKNKKKKGRSSLNEDNRYSDTIKFFNAMKKPITEKSIAEDMDRYGFSGVATIYDIRKNIVYLFSTREIACLTDKRSFLIAFSYAPSSTKRELSNFLGMSFYDKVRLEISGMRYEIKKGVHKFNLGK